MKILLVEDEEQLRKLTKRFLERHGYLVDDVDNGKDALERVSANGYDCLVLDLNLPEVDGVEVAKRIRDSGNSLPIIMLTARSQIYDKLEGFDNGADDYMTKPFDMKELLARVKAILRRGNSDVITLSFNGFDVVPSRNVLMSDEKEIQLSNKEMGILEYMIMNKEKIVSSEELLDHVWDSEVDFFTDTVKTHIKTLRKKIDPKKKFIKTVRGKGYLYNE